MRNHILLTVLAVLLLLNTVYAQTDKVKGNLTTIDTADLTILNIYPDSFPNVSVVFRAEKRNGEPVWGLTREKMKVKENSKDCEVVSVEPISKYHPINIGIVIDHSGSMGADGDINFLTGVQYRKLTAPIDNAKSAVKNFVSTFNFSKDFISVIGFATDIDEKLPLTKNISDINSIVDGMKATSSTALYDAMLAGIDEVTKGNGIKVLVVLTDGFDNASTYTSKDVIDRANKENMPVYIIGLGFVNIDTLQHIAKSTKGQFYFTRSSTSLDTIYALISKQVQSYYNLVYTSPNLSSEDSTRKIELSFDVDSTYLVTNPETINLPAEVLAYMDNKEKKKEYLLDGGIALAILIAAGTLFFFFAAKRKDKPVINKLYPNPTKGIINVEFESPAGELQIINLNGQTLKTIEISGNEVQVDLSQFGGGNYIAIIQADGQRSNAVKFIILQ